MLEKISDKVITFKFSFDDQGAKVEIDENTLISKKDINKIALLLARMIAKSEGIENKTLVKEGINKDGRNKNS